MKAFVLEEPGKALIKEVEEAVLTSEYGAKLSPVAMSVCTSDVNTVYGSGRPKPKDLILGHECVAKVVCTGRKVRDFQPGDIVAVPAMTPNWRHPQVQEGNVLHAGGNFSANTLGRSSSGVFAEYFVVEDADLNLALMPADIRMEDALMCTDMATTGFSAAETADIQTGDTVVVLGIGAVGLMAIQASALHGAARIIAVGSREICKPLAYRYGATEIYDYRKEDIVKKVLEETGGVGADVVLICGGNDESLGQAMEMVRYGIGRVVNVKLFAGAGDMRFSKFYAGRGMAGKTLHMELGKGGRVRMERLLQMVRYGRISPGDLVTHCLTGFDQIGLCLEMMREKGDKLIKTMLIPEWK